MLISATLNIYLLQGEYVKGRHLLDYRLRCGYYQIFFHGLGDGGVKEKDDVSKIVIFVVVVIIVRGDYQ